VQRTTAVAARASLKSSASCCWLLAARLSCTWTVFRVHRAPRACVTSTGTCCLPALPKEKYPTRYSYRGYCMPSALQLTSKVKTERRSAESSEQLRPRRLRVRGTMQQQQRLPQRFHDPASKVATTILLHDHPSVGECLAPHLPVCYS
jgi:hypothetical protein